MYFKHATYPIYNPYVHQISFLQLFQLHQVPQDITNVFRIKDFLHLQFQLLSNGIKNIPPGNGHSLTCPKNNDSSRGYNMNAVVLKKPRILNRIYA